jgi:hypothetical protein
LAALRQLWEPRTRKGQRGALELIGTRSHHEAILSQSKINIYLLKGALALWHSLSFAESSRCADDLLARVALWRGIDHFHCQGGFFL